MLWECGQGHQWYASGTSIKFDKSWCPHCLGRVLYIEYMHALAAKRGGKCLSEEYINSTTKLEWQCSKDHIWKSAPTNIISKKWCPVCGHESTGEKRKNDIEIYRNAAMVKRILILVF